MPHKGYKQTEEHIRKVVLATSNKPEDFWLKVDKKNDDDCWNWMGCPNSKGYGRFRFNKKEMLSHRLSWIFIYGKIPKGMFVCHTCDNPLCVNPNHLWLGTQKENLEDMVKKGRGGSNGLSGEEIGTHKLSEKEVLKIRRLYNTKKYTQRNLVRMFNVGLTTINYILNRKSWKHL